MDDDLEFRIRVRAYELWEANGKPNGYSFWEEAEAEINRERAKTLNGSTPLHSAPNASWSLECPPLRS